MDQAKQIENLIKNFNWNEPSWSLFIILGWLGLSVLYALASGRGRVLGLLLSIYAALVLSAKATFLQSLVASKMHVQTPSLQALVVFAALFVLIFLAVSKHGFKLSAEGRGSGFVFAVIFSILQIGLLVSIVLQFLPSSVLDSLAPLIKQMFIDSQAPLFWMAAPLVFLIFFGRFVANKPEA